MLLRRDGTDHGTQVTDHRHGRLLHGRGRQRGRGTARNGDVKLLTSAKRAAPRDRGDGVRYRQAKNSGSAVLRAGRKAVGRSVSRLGRPGQRARGSAREVTPSGRAVGTARSTSIHCSPTSSGRSPVGDDVTPGTRRQTLAASAAPTGGPDYQPALRQSRGLPRPYAIYARRMGRSSSAGRGTAAIGTGGTGRPRRGHLPRHRPHRGAAVPATATSCATRRSACPPSR